MLFTLPAWEEKGRGGSTPNQVRRPQWVGARVDLYNRVRVLVAVYADPRSYPEGSCSNGRERSPGEVTSLQELQTWRGVLERIDVKLAYQRWAVWRNRNPPKQPRCRF